MKIPGLAFVVWSLTASSVGAATIDVCPWKGPGTALFSKPCADPTGCSLEVYALDPSPIPEWAKARCLNDAPSCADWQSCQSPPDAQGLTYLAYTVKKEVGGLIRYNAAPGDYSAVLAVHPGGGGTSFVDEPRDVRNDTTDWKDLQDGHGLRVVGIQWAMLGVSYMGHSAGRWTRPSSVGMTFSEDDDRVAAIVEWIDQHLNGLYKPFGMIGSSGGGDAVVGLAASGSSLADRAAYLGVVSYAPLYDFYHACLEQTPTCAYVNPADGSLGKRSMSDPGNCPVVPNAVGASAKNGSGETINLPDDIWNTNDCQGGTVSPASQLVVNSSDKDLLQARVNEGKRYRGTLHVTVATASPDGIKGDNQQGITWAAGNLYHHAYFSGAKRIWDECKSQGHGTPLSQPDLPCFDRVYEELIHALAAPTPPPSDAIAPAPIMNLSVGSPTASSLQANWVATGDDGFVGTAASYDLRYGHAPITDATWPAATAVSGEPTPAPSGAPQSLTVTGLAANTTYHFAMKISDEVGNLSALSNVPSAATAKSGDGSNASPEARASAKPTSGEAPLTVQFSSEGSSDSDGSIVAYQWEFGDGEQSTEPHPQHVYTAPDTYTATLAVTDDGGRRGASSVRIAVSPSSKPMARLILRAEPASIVPGGHSLLTWRSEGVDGCEASGGWRGVKAIRGSETVTPAEITTYTLNCQGQAGAVTESVVVSVTPARLPPVTEDPVNAPDALSVPDSEPFIGRVEGMVTGQASPTGPVVQLAGARVVASSSAFPSVRPFEVVTDAQGRYVLELPVEPGGTRYVVAASHAEYLPHTLEETIKPSATATLNFSLTKPAAPKLAILEGVVREAEAAGTIGQPIAGARLIAQPAAQLLTAAAVSPERLTTVTDAQGRYRLELPAGEQGIAYRVTASRDGYAPQTKEHLAQLGPAASLNFTLSRLPPPDPAVPDLALAEIVIPERAKSGEDVLFQGRVKNEGKASARTRLRVLIENPLVARPTPAVTELCATDVLTIEPGAISELNSCRWTALAGRYTVIINADPAAGEIDLADNGVRRDLLVESPLPAQAVIEGLVTEAGSSGAAGPPIAGARVEARSIVSAEIIGAPRSLSTVTDAQGRYKLEVPVDAQGTAYRVTAGKDGYTPQTKQETLKPGQSMALNFSLQPMIALLPPDLAVIEVKVPDRATAGDRLAFSARVKNEGQQAGVTRARFTMTSQIVAPSAAATTVAYPPLCVSEPMTLQPGQVSSEIPCAWTAVAGRQVIRIAADPAQGERDLADNQVTRLIEVAPATPQPPARQGKAIIEGAVMERGTGMPLVKARIDARATAANAFGKSMTAYTDPQGRYRFEVGAGGQFTSRSRYQVTASRDGYLPQTETQVVEPDRVYTIGFALEAASRQLPMRQRQP